MFDSFVSTQSLVDIDSNECCPEQEERGLRSK